MFLHVFFYYDWTTPSDLQLSGKHYLQPFIYPETNPEKLSARSSKPRKHVHLVCRERPLPDVGSLGAGPRSFVDADLQLVQDPRRKHRNHGLQNDGGHPEHFEGHVQHSVQTMSSVRRLGQLPGFGILNDGVRPPQNVHHLVEALVDVAFKVPCLHFVCTEIDCYVRNNESLHIKVTSSGRGSKWDWRLEGELR